MNVAFFLGSSIDMLALYKYNTSLSSAERPLAGEIDIPEEPEASGDQEDVA
jgi:hypothetical protein